MPGGVVIVGVSTGGPRVLEEILPALAGNFPWPVVVIQHMPATFTQAFARRLDGHCALQVREVRETTPLAAGHVYVARGSADAVLVERSGRLCMISRPADPAQHWHPSVTVMMDSARRVLAPERLIGVMLTGMGNDGAASMAALRHEGGRTLAESQETAAVFGMPAELIRLDGATEVAPSHAVAAVLTRWLQHSRT
jgi:two-component system chemotaxis response regulator CheB